MSSGPLSFFENASDLRSALDKIRSVPPTSKAQPWMLTTVTSNSVVKLDECGEDGGIPELVEELSHSKEHFGLVRVVEPSSGLVRFLLILWCGEGVPPVNKARFASHIADARRFFGAVSLEIVARSEDDVEPKQILKKMRGSMGSRYESGSQKASGTPSPMAQRAVPPPRVVGTLGHVENDTKPVWQSQRKSEVQNTSFAPPSKYTSCGSLNSVQAPVPASKRVNQSIQSNPFVKRDSTKSSEPPSVSNVASGMAKFSVSGAPEKPARKVSNPVDSSSPPKAKVPDCMPLKASPNEPDFKSQPASSREQISVGGSLKDRMHAFQKCEQQSPRVPLNTSNNQLSKSNFESTPKSAPSKWSAPKVVAQPAEKQSPAAYSQAKAARSPGPAKPAGRLDSVWPPPGQSTQDRSPSPPPVQHKGFEEPPARLAPALVRSPTPESTWHDQTDKNEGSSWPPKNYETQDSYSEQPLMQSSAGSSEETIYEVTQEHFPDSATDELHLYVGQQVAFLNEPFDSWWMVRELDSGRTGLYPSSYLGPVAEAQDQSNNDDSFAPPQRKAPQTVPLDELLDDYYVPDSTGHADISEQDAAPPARSAPVVIEPSIAEFVPSRSAPVIYDEPNWGEVSTSVVVEEKLLKVICENGPPEAPNEISLRLGDQVVGLGESYNGWMNVRHTETGEEGIYPTIYLEAVRKTDDVHASEPNMDSGATYIAMYDYDAVESTDLALVTGSRIVNVDTSSSDWWHGTIEGTMLQGFFPASYVEREV